MFDAVGVDVLARDDAVARGAANRPLGKGVRKGDAPACEPVQVGRDHVFEAQKAQGIPALLVRDDEDDIGLFQRLFGQVILLTIRYGRFTDTELRH